MNKPFIRHIYTIAVLAFLGMGFGAFPVVAAQKNVTAAEEGMDVLTYGPIHEAFAETVEFDPEPGIIVPKAPPDAIHEIPPDQKPESDVEWIPGYWAWDGDRTDFIWVSGIWGLSRRIGNGSRGIGSSPGRAFNGFPATGTRYGNRYGIPARAARVG